MDIWHQQLWLKYKGRAESGTWTEQGPFITMVLVMCSCILCDTDPQL